MGQPLTHIHCKKVQSISGIQIVIPNTLLAELGNPTHLIFDENDMRLRVPTINTAKQSTVSYNSSQSALVSITPKHTPVDTLLGYWEHEVEDLSIYLTEKIK